jgi:hypothetical protein
MRRKHKLDRLDAAEIEQTLASPGWQFIQQRIERTIQQKVDEVLAPLDPVKTAQLRGAIEGLKIALRVPEILKAEAAVKAVGKEREL